MHCGVVLVTVAVIMRMVVRLGTPVPVARLAAVGVRMAARQGKANCTGLATLHLPKCEDSDTINAETHERDEQ